MARREIEINYKQPNGYDQLMPDTFASAVEYDNNKTDVVSTNVQGVLDEIAYLDAFYRFKEQNFINTKSKEGWLDRAKIFGNSTQDGVPTPSNPIEIVDSVEPTVTSCGKNLCSVGDLKASGSWKELSSNWFASKGNITISADTDFPKGCRLLLKTKYSTKDYNKDEISKIIKLNTTCGDNNTANYITTYDGGNFYMISHDINKNEGKNKWTITLNSSVLGDFLIEWNTGDVTQEASVTNLQIEVGTTPTPYEPYQGQSVKLDGITLRSMGNVRDYIDIKKGVIVRNNERYIVKREDILNVETFYNELDFANLQRTSIPTLSNAQVGDLQTNKFKRWTRSKEYDDILHIGECCDAGSIRWWFGFAKGTSLEEMRNVCEGMVINYKLETPIEEPIPEPLLSKLRSLQAYDNETNVFTDNALLSLGVPRIDLGYKALEQIYMATITTTWSGNKQEINVEGIKAIDNPTVDVVLGDNESLNQIAIDNWNNISRITTQDGKITVYAYEDKPTASINIQLKVVR